MTAGSTSGRTWCCASGAAVARRRCSPDGCRGRWRSCPLGFVVVFFAWPVASIIGRGLSVGAVTDVLTDPGIRSVAWFTFWQATLSTVLTVAVGLPGAYVMARYQFRGRRAILAFVTVPFVLPTVVVGAAFLALLPRSLHDSVWAIIVAHVFFNYAVVVRTVSTIWAHVDPRLEEAARVLGASRLAGLPRGDVAAAAPGGDGGGVDRLPLHLHVVRRPC